MWTVVQQIHNSPERVETSGVWAIRRVVTRSLLSEFASTVVILQLRATVTPQSIAVYMRHNVIMLIRCAAVHAIMMRGCVHYAMSLSVSRSSVRPPLDGQLDAANLFTDDGLILQLARARSPNCYQTLLGLGRFDRSTGQRSVIGWPAYCRP